MCATSINNENYLTLSCYSTSFLLYINTSLQESKIEIEDYNQYIESWTYSVCICSSRFGVFFYLLGFFQMRKYFQNVVGPQVLPGHQWWNLIEET